jgi:hypothetical protein
LGQQPTLVQDQVSTSQDQVLDQPTQQQPGYDQPSGNAPIFKLPSVALPGFIKAIGPKSRILASKLRIPKLPSVNKKIIVRSSMAVAAVLIVSAVGGGVYYKQELKAQTNPTVPVALKAKTDYTVLYPVKNAVTKVDETTFKYDEKDKLLSYIAYTPNKTKLTISQQAQPNTLKEGQPAYDLLIKRLLGYKTFQTAIGEVNLTRPAQFQGDQFAVLRTNDSLLFIRPAKDIPDSQWKAIFDSFEGLK